MSDVLLPKTLSLLVSDHLRSDEVLLGVAEVYLMLVDSTVCVLEFF